NASLFDYGALSLVPKVENIPSPDPVLFVKASKSAAQPLPIYGVLGIAPSLEEGLTGVGRFIIGGELRDDDEEGVVMSRKLADALGVRIGGTIEVYRSDMSVVKNFTLRAFLEDGFFESLDLDGNSLPPSKLKGSDIVKTNQTETLLFTPKAALKIYEEEKSGIGISRIFVKLSSTSEETLSEFAQAMVHKGYTAWVFRNGMATKYYIGSVFKVEGLEQFLIPFVLVVLNVSLVMMNLLHERAKEVSILSMVGLNPGHIATVFMAESIVMGLVGGGLGYFLGLGMYRLMSFLSPESQIAVREKLEWYWGVVSIAIALLVAVVSAIRPAIKAAMLATPSMVRKMKVTQEERLKRDKEIFKVYLGREFGLPIRVHEREEPFFSSYLTDRLRELMTGLYDRVEEFSLDEQVLADGTRVKRFLFNYIIIEGRNQYTTVNEIIARKKPQTDFYTLSLLSKPKSPGLPEHITETTLTLVKDLVLDWDREKGRIIGKI
ncbi:MAG: FtsX-like permease family protein, partial [Candidatus Bathyarchaeia archaeon]